ncbi:MAG: type II toxin-antitoxin system VapC family toxin [Fibrobacterota bacterium]
MKKRPFILDAHALMVYLEGEAGADKLSTLFAAAVNDQAPLLMTSVNYGEILYITLREYGEKACAQADSAIEHLPVEIVDVDRPLVKIAAQFKARGGLSYADCFAAALAKLRNGTVITGDPEFKAVENEVPVLWI